MDSTNRPKVFSDVVNNNRIRFWCQVFRYFSLAVSCQDNRYPFGFRFDNFIIPRGFSLYKKFQFIYQIHVPISM